MDWRDTGVVLSARPHAENSVILEVLTDAHGRHAGVVRGGTSRKIAPHIQPGAEVQVTWRARLEEHLGSYTIDPVRNRMARVMHDPLRLSALSALCATARFALPEREPLPDLVARTRALTDAIEDGQGWLADYLEWEMALLAEMGFGLDLSECANGGGANDLAYVSPKTGRAVSRAGAGEWASRLLPLPECLLGGRPTVQGAQEALTLTGYFLTDKLAPSLGGKPFPAARQRFLDQLARAAD